MSTDVATDVSTSAAPASPPAVRPPSFFDRWPGPAVPPPLEVLTASAAVGVTTAGVLPTGVTGVGWLCAVVVALTLTILVRWTADADGPPRPVLPADVGWAVTAVALCAVGSVRDAAWLGALCLLGAVAAASLALVGRSFPSLLTSLTAPAVAMLRALPWLRRGLRTGRRPALGRAVAVGLAAVAVLVVFVPLLESADAAFAHVVALLTPAVEADSVTRGVFLFALGGLGTAGACFLLLAPPEPVGPEWRPTRLRLLDWALPTGLLVAVLALFVGVQFVVLFGADDYVVRTTGVTYAEYARGGFWQLLVVTALTLGVLAAGSRWAPVRTAAERAVKRGLLAELAVLTLVLVASALHRMWLYQQAYGFTVLRLLVLTVEMWLAAGLVLALVAVLRLRPAGLGRPMVAAGMLALLGLAVLDPEGFVAEHNVARWAQTGRLDTAYLSGLSADAVPALVALPEPLRSCTLADRAARLADPDDWRSANLSRATARDLLRESPPTCDVRWSS